MMLKGKARRLKIDDNINTDYIISGRYKFKIQDAAELAKHLLEDLDPNFVKGVEKGDILVTGHNFGCGSSREQAPQAIKFAHISAILAKSFARIFYRNCFNLGLPAIECDTSKIKEGDNLEIDLEKGIIKDSTSGMEIKIKPLPKVMQILLSDGGLVEHFKKYGKFAVT